ncbi:hypothetical protein IK146_02835 [Candidatus Saccharibacteria bacterium]|nr:hypothetical protein [Candidatus Saccharibacteria bacterium]
MIQGLNRLRQNPNTPVVTPEQSPPIVEIIPQREEARHFGEHVLRYHHNIQEMSSIVQSRNKPIEKAVDELDISLKKATERLNSINAKASASLNPTITSLSRHRFHKK